MDFEEALKAELSSLQEVKKVYPIVAQQESDEPFVVYRNLGFQFSKTLDGIIRKTDAIYEIKIVSKKYTTMRVASKSITNLFIGFFNRMIGSNGPSISNVNVEGKGDSYDPESMYFITEIQLTVTY